eukprot:comp12156_c0_seq1/m.6908 comp12156_c0_seq1/g.6908  ORF comp12156_c0_seq1/g.6908 comp12156_c0_seq1/m.6908 type:complete len:425 (-) comp12156_c0_seq1:169-1443(-)
MVAPQFVVTDTCCEANTERDEAFAHIGFPQPSQGESEDTKFCQGRTWLRISLMIVAVGTFICALDFSSRLMESGTLVISAFEVEDPHTSFGEQGTSLGGIVGALRLRMVQPNNNTVNMTEVDAQALPPCVALPMADRRVERGGWFDSVNMAKNMFEYVAKIAGMPLPVPCREYSADTNTTNVTQTPSMFTQPLWVPTVMEFVPADGVNITNGTFEYTPAVGTVNVSVSVPNDPQNATMGVSNITVFVSMVNTTELLARAYESPMLTIPEQFDPNTPWCDYTEWPRSRREKGRKLQNLIHRECVVQTGLNRWLVTGDCESEKAVHFCVDKYTYQLRSHEGLCAGIDFDNDDGFNSSSPAAPLHLWPCDDYGKSWIPAGWYGWQIYNNNTRLCWDVAHQHKGAPIIQWKCKTITDYKPPNQWFLWV